METSIHSFNSAIDPITFISFPSSVIQTGRGTPQNLERERFQSFAFDSQFPNRPSPVDLGFQFIFLFSELILSRTFVIFMNQDSKG